MARKGNMAVPENQRGKSKFEVFIKALDLCTYTIKICTNKNIFLEQYQNALTEDIIRTSKDIFIDCWTANNIMIREFPKDQENAVERKKLRRMVHLARSDKMEKRKVDDCYAAWKAHVNKGNSTKLLKRMDKYYTDLWRAIA